MWPFTAKYPLVSLEEVAGHEYDYIVVGAGTAGCALASRLSEDPATSVLLVEKGSYNNRWFTRIPLASSVNGEYMVKIPTQPDQGAGNRQQEIIAAETVGGNTRLNGMIYTRGVPAYYNRWAHIGYPTWDWAAVEPFFRKVEERHSSSIEAASATVGAVRLRQQEPTSRVYPFLQKAAEAFGLHSEVASNRPEAPASGFHSLDLTIDSNCHRHSAERAYLPYKLVMDRRRRLHICPGAAVVQLDLSPAADSASGLILSSQLSKSDKQIRVKAKREIMLCAGVAGTAQILQLSGIGPRSLLQKHGITVQIDLDGVGCHVQDHAAFPVWVDVAAHDSLHEIMSSPAQALKHFALYTMFGTGWLKSSIDYAIFFNTRHLDMEKMVLSDAAQDLDSSRVENIPDVEIMILPVNSRADLYPHQPSITFLTILNQPYSMGTIDISSADHRDRPNICLQIRSDPRDKDVAHTALRFALRLAEQFVADEEYPHPSSILAWPGAASSYPGWDKVSDEDADDYIEKRINSNHHLRSSCRMARREHGSVVDDELRIHGLKNVRIADASVLPQVPPAHPMAAVYMVAERCAEFAKAARGKAY